MSNKQLITQILAGNYPDSMPLFNDSQSTFACDMAKRSGIREGWLKHNWRYNRCKGVINAYNEAATDYNQHGCARGDNVCKRNAYIKHFGPGILPPFDI